MHRDPNRHAATLRLRATALAAALVTAASGALARPVTARGAPSDLAIIASAAPSPVASGTPLTATLTVSNEGPDYSENSIVTVLTPAGTTFASASTTSGTCLEAPEPGGTGTIQCEVANLDPGDVHAVTIVVNVVAAPGAVVKLEASVEPTASVDPNVRNNSATVEVPVVAGVTADVAVSLGPSAPAAGSGSLYAVELNVDNIATSTLAPRDGRDAAPDVVLTTATPEGTVFAMVESTAGDCSAPPVGGTGTVVCSLGTVEPGARVSVSLVLNVTEPVSGTFTVTASVVSSATDPNPTNNSVAAIVPVAKSGVATLTWDAPDAPTQTTPLQPPRRLLVTDVEQPGPVTVGADGSRQGGVLGYNVYRSNKPSVAITAGNRFTSVPAGQTSATVSVAPGGTFFVVTAIYGGGESGPSNEGSSGIAAATITKVKPGTSKIVVMGSEFSDTVTVLLDGIPFALAAKVKKQNTKVAQKGPLVTGQSVGQYLGEHPRVVVSVQNANGGIAAAPFPD